MLKIIEGPKVSALNDNADGPFAFADRDELAAHAATEWLYEYALDTVENCDRLWSDWSSAEDLMNSYVVIFEDDDTGERRETHLDADDLTPRGVAILEAAIAGEDAAALLDAWAEDIEEATRA